MISIALGYLWFQIFLLGGWVIFQMLKSVFYVEPEEAKEFERMQIRSRGRIVPSGIEILPLSLEVYDHLIIESLNYHQK